jgi:hypothetical protein
LDPNKTLQNWIAACFADDWYWKTGCFPDPCLVVKEREFSADASPEKRRLAGTAKQAECVNHNAR